MCWPNSPETDRPEPTYYLRGTACNPRIPTSRRQKQAEESLTPEPLPTFRRRQMGRQVHPEPPSVMVATHLLSWLWTTSPICGQVRVTGVWASFASADHHSGESVDDNHLEELIVSSSQIDVDHDSRRTLREFTFPRLRFRKRRGSRVQCTSWSIVPSIIRSSPIQMLVCLHMCCKSNAPDRLALPIGPITCPPTCPLNIFPQSRKHKPLFLTPE